MVQFSPDGASLEQRQSFQTELLELIMDIIHMLSHEEENNTHLISQGRNDHAGLSANPNFVVSMQKVSHLKVQLCLSESKNQRPEGKMGTLMENVVLVSKTMLRKLYSGTFLGDSECLLNFLADQIVVVRWTYMCTHLVDVLEDCSN